MALAGYVQPGTAVIDTHLQPSSGRDCGQEMKSSSPLKESMKVPGEALGESWFGQSAEAASGLLLTAGLIGWSLEKWEMGQLSVGSMLWEMQRTKTAHRNIFPFFSFP